MKKIELRFEVETENITIDALRDHIRKLLRTETESVIYSKGTMPNPNELRSGLIHWKTLNIKQRRTK